MLSAPGHLLLLATAASGLTGLALAMLSLTLPAFLTACIASVLLIAACRAASKGFSTFTTLFAMFFLLYGVSGPFNAITGQELSPLFSRPYQTLPYLLHYLLALLGLTGGVMAGSLAAYHDSARRDDGFNPLALGRVACLFAAFATASEAVNFLRVGGLDALSGGKASYQSAVSDLALTLPSEPFALLALSLLALAIGTCKAQYGHLAPLGRVIRVFFITILPIVALTLLMGERGALLSWAIILTVGATWYRPITSVSVRLVLVFVVLYLALGFLFANRGVISYSVTTGDWDATTRVAFDHDRLVAALNPAANEFGATFGNFSEYSLKGIHSLRMGETYLTGMTIPIPAFAFPTEKPKAITYEFRDRYFPDEARRGRIASTAFSGIVEAHMNFGSVGVFIVYGLLGCGLMGLERLRHSPSLFSAVFYLSLLPVAQSFHRSAFGNPFFWPIVLAVLAWVSYQFFQRELKLRSAF